MIAFSFIAIGRPLALLGVVCALTACGFHLRGQATLPPAMAATYIDASGQRSPNAPPSSLATELARALQANGATIAAAPTAATARLVITKENYQRRTLATGAQGDVREYSITYQVEYLVNNADGSALVPLSTASASQDIIYNEIQVLGRVEGEQLAFQQLQREVVQAILRRLAAASP
ncbi:MAG: LPS assembly lipoprotein LptE [Gammaproteobacteria bacterium]